MKNFSGFSWMKDMKEKKVQDDVTKNDGSVYKRKDSFENEAQKKKGDEIQ